MTVSFTIIFELCVHLCGSDVHVSFSVSSCSDLDAKRDVKFEEVRTGEERTWKRGWEGLGMV